MVSLILIVILSYILGSLSPSIVIGKIFYGQDIRKLGSGNAGATNVIRELGWKAGVIVGVTDLVKGYVAAVFISKVSIGEIPISHSLVQIIAGVSAVIGHIWTIFHGFRGGKGVLTATGVFFGLAPVTTTLCLVVWGIVVYKTRYISLGSIVGIITLGIIMAVRRYVLENVDTLLFAFSVLIALLVIYAHRSNIKKLLSGTESKFERKKR
jgi:glycerol-3-phosphate acyltransferase PlsY